MLITKEITIDLVNRTIPEHVHVVQCDSNTRAVAVTLMEAGVPWNPPEGAIASVAFERASGSNGWYDQLPDGSSACTVAGNVVTAILAPEMLTVPGRVKASIVFLDADLNQISTFGFTVEVDPSATAGNAVSNSYYKYSTMEAVNAAMEAHDETIAELERAKAAGEFKGEKGDKGDKGDPGEQGPQGIQGEKGEAPDAVLYTPQTVPPEKQAQARKNIGFEEDTLIAEGVPGVTSVYFSEEVTGANILRIVTEEMNAGELQILSDGSADTIRVFAEPNSEYFIKTSGTFLRAWSSIDTNATYKVYLVKNKIKMLDGFFNGIYSAEKSSRIKRTVENPNMYSGIWVLGTDGKFYMQPSKTQIFSDLLRRSSGTITVSADFASGYEIIVYAYKGETRTYNSGWKTKEIKVTLDNCEYICFGVRKKVDGSVVDISATEETGLVFYEDCYAPIANVDDIEAVRQDVELARQDVKRGNAFSNHPFVHDKYYSHIFIDNPGNPIIPCQSIFDIAIAARLGFKVVEGNVQRTATEGKYVVIHGKSGMIGNQVETIGGADASNVVIKDTSFEDLRTLYRYRSQYEKYRTPIISLEEFLYECKKHGITPFVKYVDKTMVEITKTIVGNDFILYDGNRDAFDGMIFIWGSSTATKEDIFKICDMLGAPLMYGIHPDTSFTNSELLEIIKGVHERGCLVGWASCYDTPVNNKRFLDLGLDFSGSAWDVNDFEHGNLINAKADIDFSDFETTGTVENGVLKLAVGDTVTVNELSQYFLAKGSLHIIFNGKINLKFGHGIDNDFTSDGKSDSWFSTYFMNASPIFTITATEETTVSTIDYKASKC